MGGPVGPPTFFHQSKNLSHTGTASSKNISLSLLSDLKVLHFTTVSSSKNGDESIITIKSQLVPRLRRPDDRRKPAILREWPDPWAVSYNRP